MNRITLALIMVGLTACATSTEFERMEREQITREEYQMCRMAFEHVGRPWVQNKQGTIGYDRTTGYPKNSLDMRMEMGDNSCHPNL